MENGRKPVISVIPLRAKAPFEKQSEMDFLVRISVPEQQTGNAPPELNLGIVLDRSGSMSGSKIEKAKEAAVYCVDQLFPQDRVSFTVFDDEIHVIIPSTHPEDRQGIKRLIQKVSSGGTTALHPAWVAGGKQVAEFMNTAGLNRVILITDGLANVGETNSEKIILQAKELFKRGISTSTIGVGNDFNEDLLLPMALNSGGNSWFVESPQDFRRIFETEMEGLLREVCSRVSLRINPAEGFHLLDVLNDFECTETGDYKLPSLLAGQPLDIVLHVSLPGGVPGPAHCFELILKWDERESKVRHETGVSAAIGYAGSDEAENQEKNPEVTRAIRLLEGARIKRKAMEYMDRQDYSSASSALSAYSANLVSMPAAISDASIVEEKADVERFLADIANRKDLARTRKAMSYQSSQTQRGRREKKPSSDKS